MDRSAFHRAVEQGYTAIPVTSTLQLDRDTPVSLYARLAPAGAFCLLESAAVGDSTGRYSFLALDRQWRVTTRGGATVVEGARSEKTDGDPLDTIRELLQRYRVAPAAGVPLSGGAFGYVTYDYVRRLERLEKDPGTDPWPDVDFSLSGTLVVCDHVTHVTTIVVMAFVDEPGSADAAFDAAQMRLAEIENIVMAPAPYDAAVEALVARAPERRRDVSVRDLAATLSNFTREAYGEAVEVVKQHIFAGDIFQAVPSQQLRRPTSANPLTLYRILRSLNPSPYMYLMDTGDAQLVGASPEMLVNVKAGVVTTRPIAGTRPRGASDDDDRRLEEELLANEKEIAEHVMLVDLGRNDVGRVSEPGTVVVERLAKVERFSHLMHIVSQVSGRLRAGLDAIDALQALFPAGTLSGAPKIRAMEIIDSVEPVRRGPYGGALGYFSLDGDADFAITIRTVALRHGWATIQAGGGVVADSTGDGEYDECLTKASAPLLALEMADPTR